MKYNQFSLYLLIIVSIICCVPVPGYNLYLYMVYNLYMVKILQSYQQRYKLVRLAIHVNEIADKSYSMWK